MVSSAHIQRGVVGGVCAGSALVRQGGVTVVCSLSATLGPISTEPMMTVEWEGASDENDTKVKRITVAENDEMV